MPSELSPSEQSRLSRWIDAILYQIESVARDRLETPPLRARLETLLVEMLESFDRILLDPERGTRTIPADHRSLRRCTACGGVGCIACSHFGWVYTDLPKPTTKGKT